MVTLKIYHEPSPWKIYIYLAEFVDPEVEIGALGKLFEGSCADVADLVPVEEDLLRLGWDIPGDVPQV